MGQECPEQSGGLVLLLGSNYFLMLALLSVVSRSMAVSISQILRVMGLQGHFCLKLVMYPSFVTRLVVSVASICLDSSSLHPAACPLRVSILDRQCVPAKVPTSLGTLRRIALFVSPCWCACSGVGFIFVFGTVIEYIVGLSSFELQMANLYKA